MRENKKFVNANQMLPDFSTPRHDETSKQRTDQRTKYLSRMVYALNNDEESEVLLSRLPATSSNGPSQSSQLLACHCCGVGYPVHDSRKPLVGNDLQTPV